jgi:plastocyanin
MKKTTYAIALLTAFGLTACGGGDKPASPAPSESSAAKPAEAAPAAPAMDASNAGSITGKVAYTGPAPKLNRIKMDAEPSCAAKHSGPVMSQDVVVNPNGTLRYAIVYVKSGLPAGNYPMPSAPAVIDQDGCEYRPHVLAVMTGQAIQIKNDDQTTHNIHPLPTQNREWNKSQPPGAEPLSESFAREEITIPVKCNVHPWMKAYIGVFKHPFFAVSGEDGTFTIQGVPPGEYTIEVWQEKLGVQEQKVTVGAKETKQVDFSYAGA